MPQALENRNHADADARITQVDKTGDEQSYFQSLERLKSSQSLLAGRSRPRPRQTRRPGSCLTAPIAGEERATRTRPDTRLHGERALLIVLKEFRLLPGSRRCCRRRVRAHTAG